MKWFKQLILQGARSVHARNDYTVVCTGIHEDLVPSEPYDGEPAYRETVRDVGHHYAVQLLSARQFQLYILYRFPEGRCSIS